MSDGGRDRTLTRREYVKYGGAIAAGGLLAGCSGGSETDAAPEATDTGGPTPTTTPAESEPATDDRSYAVTMAPMGDVEFDSVPESVFTRLTHHADMAFALGKGDAVNAMHASDYYHALWNQFTERLPGVTLDWEGLYSSWEPDKETLYELDSDVHLADPASVAALDSWSQSDLSEIADNVGPWFGNTLSDRNAEPPAEWADSYEYYDLWELFERVAQVFREEERYEALADVHSEMWTTIDEGLPPVDERPTAVMVGLSDIDSIYAYRLNVPGFLTSHTRPLGATGGFDDDVSSGDTVDFETLLAADPDVVLALGGMSPATDMTRIRSDLEGHPVGRDLTAVENDRVYTQGARYQGPILNFFQVEMTAKQLYPDQFGEWPTYESGPYPAIPVEERLFDRKRVADVIDGTF